MDAAFAVSIAPGGIVDRPMLTRRGLTLLALALLFGAGVARADTLACPFKSQKPMIAIHLLFGQDIRGHGHVSEADWSGFLRRVVTPAFPDGFTVYDATGQWMDQRTGDIVRERSKDLLILSEDSPVVHENIGKVIETYRREFRQESVGLVTASACAAF
jgi:hypothetical protein